MRNATGHRFLFLVLALGLVTACRKDDSGTPVAGNYTLQITAKHHMWGVPYLPLYLKKNATEFPGTDTAVYELKVIADNEGFVSISGLHPGNYYLFGRGFDYYWGDTVIGYRPVSLSQTLSDGSEVMIQLDVSE